ncbi:glucose-6-phosphate dehydrogenase [Tautonia rosea]|uniref:glucose-6-phosphate dehydrogenase n=1 Tax=Tautonia rosea TaxID=2728037 RepID=UPI001473E072|nr:glucose-6-phosphate dehydrogenase [Tautonia rosea]
MAPDFVILGAAGDLTSRYLMPALVHLIQAEHLDPDVSILGVSRQDWNDDQFRQHSAERLKQHVPNASAEVIANLLARLQYRRADVTDRAALSSVFHQVKGPAIAYLALPPSLFTPTVETLSDLDLPRGSRIVIEKPFGTDLASAQQLNRLLHDSFAEDAVFRVDHFLMKQTIQNILGLRFANRIFEMLWNRDHIERIEITWDETVALEGRASYYDRSGALRDMIQNHLIQLLTLVCMEPPVSINARDLRDRKLDVLRAIRRDSPAEVERHTYRARYTAGQVGDTILPNYTDEEGVDPDRRTETFAQVTLHIDNWRWAGVPIVLRTGKAMAADRHEIVIRFRPVPHLAFEQSPPPSNILRLQLNPDRMALGVNINGPGDPFDLEHVELTTDCCRQELPAYARLLLDVIEGDTMLSIRDDEAEESWRIVEPILHAWSEGRVPLLEYPAGSTGPHLE